MTSAPVPSIDLNADLGEHSGNGFESDDAILQVVTSASIACGAHAGSAEVMRQTVAAAHRREVSIGAHPGYPDREGFGRRDMALAPAALTASLTSQIDSLAHCCAGLGVRLLYVKPHGALYNRAARDAEVALLVTRCVAAVDRNLIVLALSGSALDRIASEAGLSVVHEGFIDRGYMADGSLVPRDRDGALVRDTRIVADRAVSMARDRVIEAIDGTLVPVHPQSLCVHGDSHDALGLVKAARAGLEDAGFLIRPFAR